MIGLAAMTSVASGKERAKTYEEKVLPILENYCFSCHGEGISKGGFSMDEFKDLSGHLDDRKHWISIWMNVRSQVMPPSDEDQLATDEKKQLLEWIERDVFKLDPANPDPGRVTVRRLNRTEYQNAVQDLLGVTFDTREAFPADDTGYGFDNIGDVLTISPLLMEKYLTAGEEVAALALPVDAEAGMPRVDIPAKGFKDTANPSIDPTWLPFGGTHRLKAERDIPQDGEYEVRLEYSVHGAMEATTEEAALEISAQGTPVGKATLGWDQRKVISLSGKVRLTKGKQSIDIQSSPGIRPTEGEENLFLKIHRASVRGPMGVDHRYRSKGYKKIFMDGPPPDSESGKDRYARKILRAFVSRAFRRPPDEQTLDRLVAIVKEISAERGKTFEDGIRQAIAICLTSPRFLFRAEFQPEPDNPAKIVDLDEYSLASRLSFFLWSSVPDDELLSLAYNKKLRENLGQQVERMLADPRSNRLVKNFVGQWLQARDVDTVAINPRVVMGLASGREANEAFDPRVRPDMRKETEMLFDHVLRENRPAEELISARYSFLNDRLAKFYGIPGVSGGDFRKVDLTNHPERGGLLTQGTFLIVTSNPTRTSAVKRGLFVLDNLLGTPAPPAPPGVPELEEAAGKGKEHPTMREMMEIHRKKPDCRGCHARMDPIGLGLENFNALGQFRATEHGKPIDTAGQLVTGEKFSDVAALKEILANGRKQDFRRCISEKLLTYAIGRGVEYYDSTTIDLLVTRMEKNNGSLRDLVLGIIESAPFQKRRGDG